MSNALKTPLKSCLFLEMGSILSMEPKNKGKGEDLFLLSLFTTCLNVSRYPIFVNDYSLHKGSLRARWLRSAQLASWEIYPRNDWRAWLWSTLWTPCSKRLININWWRLMIIILIMQWTINRGSKKHRELVVRVNSWFPKRTSKSRTGSRTSHTK